MQDCWEIKRAMPIERRTISLLGDELQQAVEAFRRVTPDALPTGALRAVRVEDDGTGAPVVTVFVQTRGGTDEQSTSTRLRDATVLSLLIRFCLENNIPIPKRGKKMVAVVGGLLTLIVDLTGEVVPQ